MPRRAIPSGVIALCAAILLLAFSAGAQTAPDAEATFERGRVLRAEHRDAEAREVFARMHAATGEPRALAQVALAEGALGRWVDAEAHLAAVLSGPGDAWTGAHVDALDAALATVREHLGSLVVECATPGAEALVAGGAVVALPLDHPLRAVAGSTPVEVRAPGRPSLHRVVTVPVGGLARETFAFPATAPVVPAAAVLVIPPPFEPPRSRRGWAIGAAVTAGAAVVAGTVVYALGLGEVSAYNADPACPGLDVAGGPPTCTAHVDAADGMRAAAIGLWVGGGVLAGASVALFATEPRRHAVALSCAPGLASLSCALRF